MINAQNQTVIKLDSCLDCNIEVNRVAINIKTILLTGACM